MATTQKVRPLPRDFYEAIHFSSLAFGGIGAGRWDDETGPVCYVGHRDATLNRFDRPLSSHGITVGNNDRAVRAINKRTGRANNGRVPFEAWAKELNVVPVD